MAAANKAARSVDRVKEPEAAAVATAIVATREGVEDLMGGGAGGGGDDQWDVTNVGKMGKGDSCLDYYYYYYYYY